jgi:hypothetical protein
LSTGNGIEANSSPFVTLHEAIHKTSALGR